MRTSAIKQRLFHIGVVGIGGFLLLIGMWRAGLNTENNTKREIVTETVVVAEPSDPYYGLAQQIAETEKLEIVQDFSQVLDLNPRFVLLVASPDNLTKQRFSNIGRVFQNSDYYPGLGVISGSTLGKAEQLWERRNSAQASSNYVGGDTEVSQLIYAPTIFDISEGATEEIALDKDNLIEALKQADYFYWTRHTGAKTWFWNEASENWGENDELFARDIPALKPVVIYSPTCSVFRPWVKDSIALAFVDQGAAAYLGFVNSPHTNAFLKRGLSVPGLTSWEEFPLGLVAQVQNRSAVRTDFTSPQFFMLGDPRIYLSKQQPYQIASDTVKEDGKRVVEGRSSVNGVLAVRIAGGADYGFLTVKGLTSVGEYDPFYDSKLQTLNLGADKYISFLHQGGSFEIELSRNAPFGWGVGDALTDALDYSWVVLWVDVHADDNPYIYWISPLIFMVILAGKILWRKRSVREYRKVFLVAFLCAVARWAYFLLRREDYSVTANLIDYTVTDIAVGFLGVFASLAGGLMLMKDTQRTVVKALGLGYAVLRQLWLAGFYLAFITFLNSIPQVTNMTEPWLSNYSAFWLTFIVLLSEISIVLALYRIVISDKRVMPSILRVPRDSIWPYRS